MSYFAFTIPASITCLIPEIVTEVSAMFVATITFLHAYKIIIISTYVVSLLGFIVDNPYVILNNSVFCQMHQFKWSCKIVLTSNRVTTLPIKIQTISTVLTGGVFWKTFSCCGAGRAAYNGNTINRGPTTSFIFNVKD